MAEGRHAKSCQGCAEEEGDMAAPRGRHGQTARRCKGGRRGRAPA